MNRAALYLRLSREDEEKRYGCSSESIENQRLLLRNYAKNHQLIIVREYADEDFSGLTDQRPGFQRMLSEAKMGCFDMILAKDQSRFSRNMQHIEQYLHRELKKDGIRFIGITDGTDTGEKSNKKARQIYGLINEWYSEDLSENVRAVLHRKVQDGQFIGSFAPFGYKKDGNHCLYPDQENAKVVEEIFEWYVKGHSMRKICRLLREAGIRSPFGKENWNPVTIKRILTNEAYLGHLIQGKSTNRSYKDRKRIYFSKENWVRHPDMHEPLISRELFEEVQSRIDGKL